MDSSVKEDVAREEEQRRRMRALFDAVLLRQMTGRGAGGAGTGVDAAQDREATIFVSIFCTARRTADRVSRTIVDAFMRAQHPRRVRVGVYASDVSGDVQAACLKRVNGIRHADDDNGGGVRRGGAAAADAVAADCVLHNVTVVTGTSKREWDDTWRGVSHGRSILEDTVYRDETYVAVVPFDATFDNGWDTMHIAMLHACPARNAILTTVPPALGKRHGASNSNILVPTRPSLLPANAALVQACSRAVGADDRGGDGNERPTLATLMEHAARLTNDPSAAAVVDRDLGTRFGSVTMLDDAPNYVRVYAATPRSHRALPRDLARFRSSALPPFVAARDAEATCRLGALQHLLSLRVVTRRCRFQPRRSPRSGWWSAAFMFTYGRLVRDVPHDPFYVDLPQSLYECLMTARYTCAGWQLFVPADVCVYQDRPAVSVAAAAALQRPTDAPPSEYARVMARKSLDRALVALGVASAALFSDSCTALDGYRPRDGTRLRTFLAQLGLSTARDDDGGATASFSPSSPPPAEPPRLLSDKTVALLQRLRNAAPRIIAGGGGGGAEAARGRADALLGALCASCHDDIRIRQTSRELYTGVSELCDVAAIYGTRAAYEQELNTYPLPPVAA